MLEARHMSVRLGGRSVLQDIDLCVEAPGVTALLGPNGAGKTTLLRALLGLIRPSVGIASCSQHCGYVPQQSGFHWHYPMTCLDVVRTGFIRGLFGAVRATDRCVQALDQVKMAGLAHRPIAELSGGQRQRVLLARALAPQPDTLVLDEPFTGVDVPSQLLITEVLSKLVDVTVFMSTHDIPAALHSAHSAVLLRERIIAHAPIPQLQSSELWADTFQVPEESSIVRGYVKQVEVCR
ncbi:metal ABC transporter ATP-binding protein [Corynebacterium gerontici]|uniref:High-affinity zinc uptake system ATP-binding protein ZnuC n=1 Tax=Corynebacterium gerontici TaxID=2079234 RepID=A0A3G6IY44_9CORY|nr:ATP-binding cassette domain-containing protein [Corynebacterium gerontici]AZA10612.1 High-affinity zinc uptake system ATP-binding protein ZnuC [Corynebacterium gerontici]